MPRVDVSGWIQPAVRESWVCRVGTGTPPKQPTERSRQFSEGAGAIRGHSARRGGIVALATVAACLAGWHVAAATTPGPELLTERLVANPLASLPIYPGSVAGLRPMTANLVDAHGKD